ncbi:MAG: hypothetical protein HC925_03250, partial [Coleofasciculaceae cyanobacterium SM2_3_26]|nr:hypothetical protein [Coleofasciculaceae cyanobacterium SM2_3_26]
MEPFAFGAIALQKSATPPPYKPNIPIWKYWTVAIASSFPAWSIPTPTCFKPLLKGLGDDRVLKDWFCTMTGPSAVHLTPEDCYAAARHGCLEAIESGVTTLVDFMYAHPGT